jgi:hypothetical protein
VVILRFRKITQQERIMSMASIIRLCLFIMTMWLSLPGVLSAETTAEALKQQIQQRSEKIKDFRALLNNPDQATRLAALDVMLKSDDLAMRELAYGVGFNSADDAMRAVCLKNKLADLQTIAIKISEINAPSKTQQKGLAAWGGIYSFDLKDYDEKTGRFGTAGTHKNGNGQVSGIGLEFYQKLCSGSFKLSDGNLLEGELGCSGGWSGTYPGQIRLH